MFIEAAVVEAPGLLDRLVAVRLLAPALYPGPDDVQVVPVQPHKVGPVLEAPRRRVDLGPAAAGEAVQVLARVGGQVHQRQGLRHGGRAAGRGAGRAGAAGALPGRWWCTAAAGHGDGQQGGQEDGDEEGGHGGDGGQEAGPGAGVTTEEAGLFYRGRSRQLAVSDHRQYWGLERLEQAWHSGEHLWQQDQAVISAAASCC